MKIKNSVLKLIYFVSEFLGCEKNVSVVLCYHSLSEKVNKYAISVSEFKKQIILLKKSYSFVELSEIVKFSLTGKRIALTFDDGYKDVLQVKEFLKKNNIPVTVFILSNPSQANRKELDHNGKLLSLDEIKQLHKLGWTIGCHSATHTSFERLSKKDLEKEITQSKKELESKLGFAVNYFAYPKGIYGSKIVEIVRKASFTLAFAANPGLITKKNNIFILPRFVMENTNVFSIPASFSNIANLLRTKLYSL